MMPPGAAPGGLPPELAALVGGAGPDAGAPLPDQSAGGSPEDEPLAILQQMIGLAKNYMEAEPDQEDKATMAKLLATLQQYLAKDQADRDKLLGNPALARVLR